MSENQILPRRQYGNIIIPADAGFFGVPRAVSRFAIAMVCTAFTAHLVISMVNANVALVVTAALVVYGGYETFRRIRKGQFGRYEVEEKKMKKLFMKAKKEGKTTYRPGSVSGVGDGSFRAPGPLAGTVAKNWHIGNQTWAMIWDAHRRTGTIWFSVATSGLQLRDQTDINHLVDEWAAFHRQAGVQGTILQIAVMTTNTTDPGRRLPLAVDRFRSHAAGRQTPEIARAVIDEVVDIENTALPRIEHIVSLTFSARADAEMGLPQRSERELAEEILTVVNGFRESLAYSSGGSVNLMTYQDVTDFMYAAYNPGEATAVEIARQSGGTGIRWEDAGPTYHNAEKDWYEHSGYYSKTFQMWRPPAATFFEDSMTELLRSDPRMTRKCVTILYRPLRQDESAQIALEVVKNANFKKGQKGRKANSGDTSEMQKAQKTEQEMGYGAILVPFSLLVTVTTDNPERFPQFSADIMRRGNTGMNLGLREATYTHDFGFALSLGAGALPLDFKGL